MRTVRHFLLAFALGAAGLVVAAPPASAQAEASVHVVQRGETLFGIARNYGITVAELRALNDLQGDNIQIGQRLVVRRAEPPRRAPVEPPAEPEPPRRPPVEPPVEPETPVEPGPPVDPDPLADPPDVDDLAPDEPRADQPSAADLALRQEEPSGPTMTPVEPLPPQRRPRGVVGEGEFPDITRPDPIPTGPPPPPGPQATLNRLTLGAGGIQPFPTEPPAGAAQEIVVERGDTLSGLARRFGTTVAALREANDLTGDTIAVGQRLTVPAGGATASPARPGRFEVTRSTVADDEVHVVRPGDTLFSIAARYGTTAGRILAVNTLRTGPLAPGTIVALPDGVGRRYYREAPEVEPDEAGLALVYPDSYVGRPTISGEAYDADELTASHRRHPFGTVLLVRAPDTGRQTLVRINDRGPVSEGFLVELSGAAAEALGLRAGAAGAVEIRVLR